MKCHNQLCIYQENAQCMLEEIEINPWGRCDKAIATVVIEPYLQSSKETMRNHLETRAVVPYQRKKTTTE